MAWDLCFLMSLPDLPLVFSPLHFALRIKIYSFQSAREMNREWILNSSCARCYYLDIEWFKTDLYIQQVIQQVRLDQVTVRSTVTLNEWSCFLLTAFKCKYVEILTYQILCTKFILMLLCIVFETYPELVPFYFILLWFGEKDMVL